MIKIEIGVPPTGDLVPLQPFWADQMTNLHTSIPLTVFAKHLQDPIWRNLTIIITPRHPPSTPEEEEEVAGDAAEVWLTIQDTRDIRITAYCSTPPYDLPMF
ncbi:uncharacterized protein MELLADRAFT_110899 [Melampsora larici-populina 98AG31]|uniref:Uncharacterized protein n=1 Tax=Melampsora larici-populina (strain 98AG31 / pathotype 3-4-7) TaxID=747676 RepID=F4S1D1_MELLP|nr:uncharacterized protein MELLADRAFT_110899 [Melampsora larici-populina 98AG31]EGG01541.1 hypothetical protein MELLADRAFT_110899 [Melampsora larici-populina 98AG31]